MRECTDKNQLTYYCRIWHLICVPAGPGSLVGCMLVRRWRVQDSGPAPFFCWDWLWNLFYGHSLHSSGSRRAVVSYRRNNGHWVLVNRLIGVSQPMKCVVRLTDSSRHDHSCWSWMLSNNTTSASVSKTRPDLSKLTKHINIANDESKTKNHFPMYKVNNTDQSVCQYNFRCTCDVYNTISFPYVGISGYSKQSSLVFNIGQTVRFEQ